MTDLRTHLNQLCRRAPGGHAAARARNYPIAKGNYPITRLPDYPIRGSAGFTLIELMVVISLIIILSTVGLVQYKNGVVHAKESVLKDDLFKMREAIDQYYADKGKYPESLDALVSEGYVRKLPDDPITNVSTSWQTVPAEADPANPTSQPGIYDVKSGSEANALDGSKYADW
jgi:general secretion pathway protein G